MVQVKCIVPKCVCFVFIVVLPSPCTNYHGFLNCGQNRNISCSCLLQFYHIPVNIKDCTALLLKYTSFHSHPLCNKIIMIIIIMRNVIVNVLPPDKFPTGHLTGEEAASPEKWPLGVTFWVGVDAPSCTKMPRGTWDQSVFGVSGHLHSRNLETKPKTKNGFIIPQFLQ